MKFMRSAAITILALLLHQIAYSCSTVLPNYPLSNQIYKPVGPFDSIAVTHFIYDNKPIGSLKNEWITVRESFDEVAVKALNNSDLREVLFQALNPEAFPIYENRVIQPPFGSLWTQRSGAFQITGVKAILLMRNGKIVTTTIPLEPLDPNYHC